MPVFPPGFTPIDDILGNPTEDAPQTIAAPAEAQSQSAVPPGFTPIDSLSPAQLSQTTVPAEGISKTESFLRGIPEGALFGFDDKLGFDKERREASKKANPWTHFLGEATGAIAPMAVAAPLAAVKGTGLLARGARAAATPFTVGETATLGQSTLQGIKLGSSYGTLSGAGHADVKPTDSVGEAMWKRLQAGVIGGAEGAIIGAPLGAASHGLGKLVGAALTRAVPEIQDVLKTASSSELQAIREIMRAAGQDKYTLDDLVALQQRLRDPEQAHLYQGLNLIEALETKPLQAVPGTGELKMPVSASPAMSATAQDAANLAGAGRHEAAQAFATRKSEMAGNIHQDIDRLFANETERAAASLGVPRPTRADEMERLPGLIDNIFGSGNDEVAAALQAERQANFNKRYGAISQQGLQDIEGLSSVAQLTPMQKAIEYASMNDMIRLAETGANWTKPWGAGDLGKTIVTLSPSNILDMHHALVQMSKPPLVGPITQENMMALQLKNWFSRWVDNIFPNRHKQLREEYSIFKRSMEANEQAAKLGSVSGAGDSTPMRFLRDILSERDEAVQAAQREIQAYNRAVESFNSGRRGTQPSQTAMNRANQIVEGRMEVIDSFARRWGENLKAEIFGAATPEAAENAVRKWLTPTGIERIRLIAGNQADGFINTLLAIEARNQGRKLSLKGGGDDAAPLTFLDRITRSGNQEAVDAFRRGWGERLKNELNAKDDNTVGRVVKDLLTAEGKSRILRNLGPDAGKEFIETLYNKQQQMGLGQRLYGNSDTAYKLARQKRLAAMSDLGSEMLRLPLAPFGMFNPSRAWQAARELVSSAYTQRSADEMNRLLAKQGPEAISGVIDTITAKNRSVEMARPYSNIPALYAAPAVTTGTTSNPSALPSYGPAKPPFPPYRQ